ncbi:MAG: SIS domain-containing protein, partial [Desulfuromonadales bacterium]|nr:SIS domain-containing protein [Desulfuromonadales bacterium]
MTIERIRAHFEGHQRAIALVADRLTPLIAQAGEQISEALRQGKKVLLMGNGGSAADAQHFAAELVGRFLRERKALPAIALTTDTSILTAVGNDYGFDEIFKRQVEALAAPG